jgi:hypothetical protein
VRTFSSDWRSMAASKKRPSADARMLGSGDGKRAYLKLGIGSERRSVKGAAAQALRPAPFTVVP